MCFEIDKLKEHHADNRAVRTIPGGGHLLAMENPAEVNRVFLEFLADLGGSSTRD